MRTWPWIQKVFVGERRRFDLPLEKSAVLSALAGQMDSGRFFFSASGVTRPWIGQVVGDTFSFRRSLLDGRNLLATRFEGRVTGMPEGGSRLEVRTHPHFLLRAFFGAIMLFFLVGAVYGVISPALQWKHYASLGPGEALTLYGLSLVESLFLSGMALFPAGIGYGIYRGDVDDVWPQLSGEKEGSEASLQKHPI